MDIHLSDSAVEALKMLAEKPCETWRCNYRQLNWVGGRTAASLVRKGLAKYEYKNQDLTVIWDFDRKVEITEAGREWLANQSR